MSNDWDWIPYAETTVTAKSLLQGIRCSVGGLADERGAQGTFHVVRSINLHTTQTRIAVQPNDSTAPRMTTKSGQACAKRRQREANCDERPWYGRPSVMSMFSLRPGKLKACTDTALRNVLYDTKEMIRSAHFCRCP
jgi:hypothetical protein